MFAWHRPQRRIAVAATAAIAALITTGCTAEPVNQTTSPTAAPFAPPAPAISPGVTDDTIKIGITYPDLESVRQYVNIDQGDYEAAYNALIDKINNAGGIQGRKIVPVYGKIDLISPTAAQETCVKLTQDESVFAVVGNFNADEPLCYVQTHRTAVIGGQLTTKRYALAQAPWFSFWRGGDEVGDALASPAAGNVLAGKNVAVMSNINEEGVMKGTVIPALQNLGITPVQTGVLDAPAQDPAAVGEQTGVFIQKFLTAGADTIVLVGSIGASFPSVLETTTYRPSLVFTDLNQANAYISGSTTHDFSTLTNAVALGINSQWDAGGNLACMTDIQTAIPALKGKLVDPATVPAGQPTLATSAIAACQNMNLLKAILDKAGRDLTYQSFQQAGFDLGTTEIATFVDPATYSRATPHGAIPARLWSYNAGTQKFTVNAN
jgi:ABC-type branched-subunit amino acid transport system substrate-binding protein